jgi:mono/diheme cytochrome c family protein
MDVEPKYRPLAASDFFPDGQSARPAVEGTVARGESHTDTLRYEGIVDGTWADSFPFPVSAQVMRRGRERFDIFCAPCHGRLGDGQGVVVRRGLRGPVSFHEPRFLRYPAGYFFAVITRGRGAMYPYASRIPVDDRWAIIAYIRALQLSQNASARDVPAGQMARLSETQP